MCSTIHRASKNRSVAALPRVASWITSGALADTGVRAYSRATLQAVDSARRSEDSPVGYAAFIVLAVAAGARLWWRKIAGGKQPTTSWGGG
jgi:hypothetical protein